MSEPRSRSGSIGPEVLAKKRGKCRMCDEPIIPREHYIRKTASRGWVHSECAREYERLAEVFDAERGDP